MEEGCDGAHRHPREESGQVDRACGEESRRCELRVYRIKEIN